MGYEVYLYLFYHLDHSASSHQNNLSSPSSPPVPISLQLGPAVSMMLLAMGIFITLSVGGLACFHWWLASYVFFPPPARDNFFHTFYATTQRKYDNPRIHHPFIPHLPLISPSTKPRHVTFLSLPICVKTTIQTTPVPRPESTSDKRL